jgi:hypothetical protein
MLNSQLKSINTSSLYQGIIKVFVTTAAPLQTKIQITAPKSPTVPERNNNPYTYLILVLS